MRNTFGFTPLFRSTIGFDRMLDVLESANRVTSIDTWPLYDIVRTSEDDYRINMAVAGLTEGDLTITQEQNMLLVAGARSQARIKRTDSICIAGLPREPSSAGSSLPTT